MMKMRVADDFTAIRARLAELKESSDQRERAYNTGVPADPFLANSATGENILIGLAEKWSGVLELSDDILSAIAADVKKVYLLAPIEFCKGPDNWLPFEDVISRVEQKILERRAEAWREDGYRAGGEISPEMQPITFSRNPDFEAILAEARGRIEETFSLDLRRLIQDAAHERLTFHDAVLRPMIERELEVLRRRGLIEPLPPKE